MYVDKWGRKPTLVVGAIGMAICHFIIVSSQPLLDDHCEIDLNRLVLLQASKTIGLATKALVGLRLSWYGFSSSILATLGVLVPGLLSPRSGRCRIVRMASLWALHPTGESSLSFFLVLS